MDEVQYLTVREFVKHLNGKISINTVYDLVKKGDMPSVKVGKQRFIPANALDIMFAAQNPGEQEHMSVQA